MGFRDCMMGGESVILVIVVIVVLSITLCCCSCSASLTLCSSLFVSAGFNILVILDWRFLIHVRPCGVVAEIFGFFSKFVSQSLQVLYICQIQELAMLRVYFRQT